MKVNYLFPVLFLFFTLSGIAQRGIKVGFVDMEYILENVPEYQDAVAQLNAKMDKWKSEIDVMSNEVKRMKESLENQKVLLTPQLIEEKEEDILLKEKELIEYQEKRFGAQGDFVLQKMQLIQPVQDQVFNEVQKISQTRKYDYVMDSSDMAMLYAAERHDLSEQILRAIGHTAKTKSRSQKKKGRKKEDAKDNRPEPYLSVVEAEEKEEQVAERKSQIEQRELDREAKRRKSDSIRQAKAAVFKKRREKMLEDRKRKRDSIAKVRADLRAKRQAELKAKREGNN